MILSPEELQQLTGRKRCGAQIQALRFMGIEHRQRPDGSVVVLRAHVEQVLCVRDPGSKPRKRTEPNWDAVK